MVINSSRRRWRERCTVAQCHSSTGASCVRDSRQTEAHSRTQWNQVGENGHTGCLFLFFLKEFCCSVLHTSLGGEGGEGMFYLWEWKAELRKERGIKYIYSVCVCWVNAQSTCSHAVTTLIAGSSTVMDFLIRLLRERHYHSSAPSSVQMSEALFFCHMGFIFFTL